MFDSTPGGRYQGAHVLLGILTNICTRKERFLALEVHLAIFEWREDKQSYLETQMRKENSRDEGLGL